MHDVLLAMTEEQTSNHIFHYTTVLYHHREVRTAKAILLLLLSLSLSLSLYFGREYIVRFITSIWLSAPLYQSHERP